MARGISLFWLCAFSPLALSHDLPLDRLNLPAGFRIDVFAEVTNPRQLAVSPTGTVFAGSRRAGKVHAIIDSNQDGVAESVVEIDIGLEMPSGIAFRDGDLFVGAVNRILVYRDVEQHLGKPMTPEVLTDALPTDLHHGWKFLDFGPDGHLYFNVGAPCNICLKDNPWYASIMRVDPDQQPMKFDVFAHGVRNTVGFTWHPDTGDLWFTDNGRDHMGDEIPPCELNVATAPGMHFGYPFVHGTDITDPEFGNQQPENLVVTPPARDLGAHVAPLGLTFYQGNRFPTAFRKGVFIAEHGSWNRSPEAGHVGYRITHVKPMEDGELDYSVFIDGWLGDNERWGRPVDLLELPDGSLLISDDKANVIYRLTWEP